MKSFFVKTALILVVLSPNAWAVADRAGGGGGKREPLFKEIATNIGDWIASGNADVIERVLPSDVPLQVYKSEMLRVLKKYNITFTDDKVMIGSFEKTCRSFVDKDSVNQIICNNTQFGADTPSNINEIYKQVHHEIAGLACRKVSGVLTCLEQNKNEVSDYRISKYIAAFVGPTTVMRLPAGPNKTFTDSYTCSATLQSDASGAPVRSCGSVGVTPDMTKLQIGPDGVRHAPFWIYFPACPEVAILGGFSENRQLEVATLQGNGKHISEMSLSATVDHFKTGGWSASGDFLDIDCIRR